MTRMTKTGRKNNHCQAILNQAQSLIERVEQAYQQREAVHELERGLFSQLLRIGDQLLGLFFELHGSGDQGAQLTLSDGQSVKRLSPLHTRAYQSIFGEYQLQRAVYGSREGQKIAYVPLDAQLQLPASKFSYLLQEWDQGLAVEQPYLQVNDTIERILGLKQSVHSLERINAQLSDSVEAFWDAHRPAPLAQAHELVVCSADAKGVVIRAAGAGQGAASGPAIAVDKTARQSDGKKMALIGAVYTVAPYRRTPEQMLEALFASSRTHPDLTPPPRPKPVAKYVRASLSRDAQDSMAPSYGCIFSWLADQYQQRDPHGQQPLVVLMDGQKSLWASAKQHFADASYVEILDLMHALGYLWDAAELFYPANAKSQRLSFVQHQTRRLLGGQVQTVIRSLCGQSRLLRPNQREALTDIVRYFRNNADRMHYDQYLQAGYPIASGVIEGACRHVVCDRMERSGMRWVIAGAEAMLKLRCIGINQDWDQFMAFHIAREQQRLYSLRPANDEHFCQLPLAA